jgi:hypothetical protein
MLTMFIGLFAAVAGVVGGIFLGRLPASGKAALALGLVPVAGLRLSMAFC